MAKKNAKIVVIGAGIAGLACASKLKENGFTNVAVLEALDRIGGRIYTDYYDGRCLEIGAQFIHGQINNPVFDILKNQCELQKEDFCEMVDVTGAHKFPVDPEYRQLCSDFCDLYAETEDDLDKFHLKLSELHLSKQYPSSAGKYFSDKFDKFVNNLDNTSKINIAQAIFDWHVRLACECNSCDPVTTLSALLYGKYHEFDGVAYTEIVKGYHQIIKFLITKIGLNNIKLNTTVRRIDYANQNVIVKTNCGDFYADYVVITLPLGVLKASHDTMFTPKLPAKKISAIENIGFGTVDKIYLLSTDPFWLEKLEGYSDCDFPDISLNVLWFDDLNYQGRSHKSGYAISPSNIDLENIWHRYIVRFAVVLNHERMLCAWIVGEGAKYAETLSDDIIAGKCAEILKSNLKLKDVPALNVAKRSKWSTDECFRGSYSFLKASCDENLITHDDLAEPLYPNNQHKKDPVVLFAGEATHSTMFSTTHGAFLSGYREADRIIN